MCRFRRGLSSAVKAIARLLHPRLSILTIARGNLSIKFMLMFVRFMGSNGDKSGIADEFINYETRDILSVLKASHPLLR